MIEYKKISKSYGDKVILNDFNLTIEAGEFLTIVGTSGSGKTTLLKMINGLVKPDSGQITVNNRDIQGQDLIELRRSIGYSIQGNVLFPHMTVFENIAYVLRLQKKEEAEIEKIVDAKLAMLGLANELKDRYPSALSGGQAQRVGIARSLAANPSILLMDEPFGAVDAITRYQLQRELKKLQKKMAVTVVFITHDIAEALKLGSRVMILDEGQIQQCASPKEILDHPANNFVKDLLEIAGVGSTLQDAVSS
ncbi:MAG: ABC transporter ATP-binding protein [Streptococcus sp.]|nr:ABC transporter ATP-binding protein [Streptococcus sp.]